MKQSVRKHDEGDKGKRGGTTGEGGEFITESEQQHVQAFPIKAQADNTLFQIQLSRFVPGNNNN